MKSAVAVLFLVLLLVTGGCTARDTLDTSWLTPKEDIPSVAPSAVNDPDAPLQPVPTGQPAIPQGQVASTNLASPPPPAPTPTMTASLPAPGNQASISFTPVIGAPVEAVQPLSRQLGAEARARGLVILQSGDANSTHILKGYFSAFTDGDKTTVGFVWDVLDHGGTRLHRIRGQEAAAGTAEDPWDVVQAATMETIAARTIADYMAWRSATGG
jgi:hypothetical protein